MRKLLNVGLFQAGWFACVLAGAHNIPLAAVVAAFVVVAVNLCWSSTDRMSDARLIVGVTVIGFCVDTAHLNLGTFALNVESQFAHLCPLWLVALWAIFATTLRASLSWLAGRYWLAAALGAIGGTLSYLAGARLGAVAMHANHAFAVSALAIGWAALMPCLVGLAHGKPFSGSASGKPE